MKRPRADALNGTVTIRHRDSMEQKRIAIDALPPWLLERVGDWWRLFFRARLPNTIPGGNAFDNPLEFSTLIT